MSDWLNCSFPIFRLTLLPIVNGKIPLKRILIAPLDWGLGHATRCIPIVRMLIEMGAEPLIAGGGRSALLLKQEFPDLEFVSFPGYEVHYPESGSLALHLLLSIPSILKSIRHEQSLLKKIIRDHRIDAVISDNRYGLYSDKVPTVFITHQINIQTPLGKGLLHKINEQYINRFSECWIPDWEGTDNLSGKLAHHGASPARSYFIGPLSRFRKPEPGTDPLYDFVIALSGPEPQRSVFEKLVSDQLKGIKGRILLLQGKTEQNEKQTIGHLQICSHLSSSEMQLILPGALLLCRSGYSSIMDAAVLGSKCIFVPTPGQTEQEYLAAYHASRNNAFAMQQGKFNLVEAMKEAEKITGFKNNQANPEVLRERLLKLSGLFK
jgi:hypothetical protein